jgi:uncharacterized protein (DUF433 family)
MSKLIQRRQNVLGGTPVIRGTRIPIARIMALIGMNYAFRDVLNEYPQLRDIDDKRLKEFITSLRSTFDRYK